LESDALSGLFTQICSILIQNGRFIGNLLSSFLYRIFQPLWQGLLIDYLKLEKRAK